MRSLYELDDVNWESEDNEGLMTVLREQIDIEVVKHLEASLNRIKAIRIATDHAPDEHERGLEAFMAALRGILEHWVYRWSVQMDIEETNRYTATVEARTYDDAKTLAFEKFQDDDVDSEFNVYAEGHAFGELSWSVDQLEEDE